MRGFFFGVRLSLESELFPISCDLEESGSYITGAMRGLYARFVRARSIVLCTLPHRKPEDFGQCRESQIRRTKPAQSSPFTYEQGRSRILAANVQNLSQK